MNLLFLENGVVHLAFRAHFKTISQLRPKAQIRFFFSMPAQKDTALDMHTGLCWQQPWH